jgi:hypothetical protein
VRRSGAVNRQTVKHTAVVSELACPLKLLMTYSATSLAARGEATPFGYVTSISAEPKSCLRRLSICFGITIILPIDFIMKRNKVDAMKMCTLYP